MKVLRKEVLGQKLAQSIEAGINQRSQHTGDTIVGLFSRESEKEHTERIAEIQSEAAKDKQNGSYDPPDPGALGRLVRSPFENDRINEEVKAYNDSYRSTKK